MSDLISRKTLMDIFQEKADDNTGLLRNNMLFAKELVKSIPTAYDVDKVWNEITDRAGKATTKGAYRTYWECAKIVKGAVKDDDYNCNSAHADIL